MKIEKITLNLKFVIGSFVTILLMGAGYSDLTNADILLQDKIKSLNGRVDTEIVRFDKRLEGGAKDAKSMREIMAIAITDIEVIKNSQRNQEEQAKEQVVLLREILKHQISNDRK